MEPTRSEFLFFSTFEKAIFYVLIFASLGYAAYQVIQRVRLWQQGKPIAPLNEGWRYWIPTRDALKQWIARIGTFILAQKKVRSSRPKTGASMHLLIFYGFLSLFIATTLLAIASYAQLLGLPNFHRGTYYLYYEATFDLLGLLFIAGVLWALVRRWHHDRSRSERPILSSQRSDYLVLGLLLMLGVTGYALSAARIAVNPQPWDHWSVVAYRLAPMLGGIDATGYKAIWWFHFAWVAVFFAILPQMRIRHVVLSIFSSAGAPSTPWGRLAPISLEEVEQTGQIGVSTVKDYSRWHLMSLDACMECGRCTEVCPAWNAGKSLNPKQVVQDIRALLPNSEGNVAAKVTEEALWACTTCNACVEACPVLIRHVDLIVDARRNLVAEGQLSGTAAVMLRQTGSTSHAWGAPRNAREDWMKGLEIPLCRNGQPFEYLFWVGCAGATDPGAVKTTKAVAELLKKANVSFACLGQEEACTGDPARRVGDEFLFQEKAMENASVFERFGVKKVVTACPHCFNSLKNEYGDFGASLEVFHHTQLLAQLVAAGKLQPASAESTVLHDPCYLARVNQEADAPRALLGEKTLYNQHPPEELSLSLVRTQTLLEPTFRAQKTRCCGAGGGRMWMDETPDERPANHRMEQLVATGAKQVAVACPFCRIMLDAAKPSDEIRLVDLAEMLQEANR